MSSDSAAGPGRRESGFGPWMRDNFVLYFVAAGAYGGSLTHWLHLARQHGQGGWSAWFLALCVDALAFQAAQERQVDQAWQRGKKGLLSFPTLVLIFSVLLTLAGQVGTAQDTAVGMLIALIPGVVLLIAIAFIERRGAERARQAKAGREREDREREDRDQREHELRLAEQETARQQQARQHEIDMERLRQDETRQQAERERQAELDRRAGRERQRQDRERQRHEVGAERHAPASRPPAANVTPSVTAAGLRAVPPPEAGANTPERQAMWAHWVHVIKAESRLPSGAELLTAGGCNPASSLGRQLAARWRDLEPARSLLAELAAGGGRKEGPDHGAVIA